MDIGRCGLRIKFWTGESVGGGGWVLGRRWELSTDGILPNTCLLSFIFKMLMEHI